MSSLSQLFLVRPCSNLHSTHIKDQHLTRPTTLRANSFTRHVSTKGRNPPFVPRITCTNVSKGDDDNRPSKLLQTLFNNINTSKGEEENKPPNLLGTVFNNLNTSKGEDENKPPTLLETVFNNVKIENIYRLSQLVNGPMSVSKILAIIHVILTRKLLLQLFSSFTAFLINHLEFTIKPTSQNGTDVGIKWNFDWKGLHIPLGKECRLNIAHVYSGKLYLSKANILANVLIEPFLHIKPIMSKLKGIAMPLLDTITSYSGGKRTAAYLYGLSSLVFMAISLILLRKTFG